jgi:hypothetical protein
VRSSDPHEHWRFWFGVLPLDQLEILREESKPEGKPTFFSDYEESLFGPVFRLM